MKTLPVGLQLYTVRSEMEKSVPATLAAVKAAGYDYVEPAGLFGLTGEQFRAELDKAGLTAVCAHVPFAQMLADPQGIIDTYKTIGCKYMAVPYLAGGMQPGDAGFEMVLNCINVFGALCHNNGITLLYHNHDFEFKKLENGEYGLDYMYSHTPAVNLQTELDTCWVNIGGEVPAEYIKKYAGRCPVVHLKDFVGSKSENMYALIGTDAAKMEDSDKFEFRPVGSGKQDFPAILEAAVESGAEYVIVEQDNTYDIPCLEAAKMSRDYLKSLGW